MTAIYIRQLCKSYGPSVVVDDVSLEILEGELFFLLGPSGCGKTTLLRAIAGFVVPDRGEIHFGDRLMNAVPARDRGTGMVFQSYALWPHMTVAENIAFGLDVRRVPRRERDQRVADAIAQVRLTGLNRQRPAQLSGGQQQRVALARALVVRPRVLLLDEPLSNLDARLRGEMREEIRRIHEETRITTVYVTHDQKEALALADRMAVMDRGRLVQQGSPREIYLRPQSAFVAGFLGETNLLEGTVGQVEGDQVTVTTPLGTVRGTAEAGTLAPGAAALCCIRPESVRIAAAGSNGPNRFRGTVEREFFFGELRHLRVQSGGAVLLSYRFPLQKDRFEPGSSVGFAIDPADVVVVPTGSRS